VLYSSVVMTVVIVVLAEVLPKTAAFNDPDRVALVVARPIAWTVRLLGPVLTAVEALVGWLLRRFGL
jgi:Mg2+/Co2+ transporter CorB